MYTLVYMDNKLVCMDIRINWMCIYRLVYAYVYTLVYMDNRLVYMDIRNKLDVDI